MRFFITFRLAGSLPAEVLARLKEEHRQDEKLLLLIKDENTRQKENSDLHKPKRYFANFDTMLYKAVNSQSWLRDEHVVKMVAEAMHFRDKKVYDLLAYCIMPNHVHIVFTIERSGASLYKILQSLKSYTARESKQTPQS